MKYALTDEDLKNSLKVQKSFLSASCNLYDQGNIEECLRIAQTLRVLLHDTSSSISLLRQLRIKDVLEFYSTHDESLMTEIWISSLTMPQIGVDVAESTLTGSKIIPRISVTKKVDNIDFMKWWEGENVLIFKGQNWTRKKLVLAASNKLGGAHVEPKPQEDLILLNQETGIFHTAMNGNVPVPARKLDGDQFSATIRQIGYEFLKTINSANNIVQTI